jgi:hypothetical protein
MVPPLTAMYMFNSSELFLMRDGVHTDNLLWLQQWRVRRWCRC